jgi:hypothetical protein
VIYVLQDGLIVETGTFAELKKAGDKAPVFNKLYRHMQKLSAGAAEDDTPLPTPPNGKADDSNRTAA